MEVDSSVNDSISVEPYDHRADYTELDAPLPETGTLPSAGGFAECILSGTRQSQSLPSAK